jgi:hypothetical protein
MRNSIGFTRKSLTPLRTAVLVATSALLAVGLGACFEPPVDAVEEEVVEGWVLSRPFPDVRSLQAVEVLAPRISYAVGTDATILRYEEGIWTREGSPEEPPAGVAPDTIFEAVSGIYREDPEFELVFAVGSGGVMLVRDETGWQQIETGTDAYLFGVWARAPDDVFAVGENGTFLRWQGGATATLMIDESAEERFVETAECDPAAPADSLLSEAFACQPDLQCNADAAATTGFRCSGLRTFPIEESLKSVRGTAPDEVFAVGERGTIFRYDGARWVREDSGTNRPLSFVFVGGGIWATATDGVLMRRNGPSDWDEDSFRVPVPLFLQSVFAINQGDVYAVGMSGRIFRREGGEWSDQVIDEDVHLRGIDGVFFDVEDPNTGEFDRARFIWAVGGGGRILRGPDVIPGDDGSNDEVLLP